MAADFWLANLSHCRLLVQSDTLAMLTAFAVVELVLSQSSLLLSLESIERMLNHSGSLRASQEL